MFVGIQGVHRGGRIKILVGGRGQRWVLPHLEIFGVRQTTAPCFGGPGHQGALMLVI